MLFRRQKRVLALVHAVGGAVSNLDFQKLLFLYCQETAGTPIYDFVPYKFGGFSFTSYADKRRLVSQGLLRDIAKGWALTPEGEAVALCVDERHQMEEFAKAYRGLRGRKLIAETYRRYPYYAIRSSIGSQVLGTDPGAMKAIQEARPKPSALLRLYTIGYEGRTIEGYLNRLIQHGVTTLCDLRRNALSRKYGFSKALLQNHCEAVDIQYVHFPELGIPSEKRRTLETDSDYQMLFFEYERTYLPRQANAVAKIRKLADTGACIALTCFEAMPQHCHRHCVAQELERRYGQIFELLHL